MRQWHGQATCIVEYIGQMSRTDNGYDTYTVSAKYNPIAISRVIIELFAKISITSCALDQEASAAKNPSYGRLFKRCW